MSAFDEAPPFKKYVISASLTLEQRKEFDEMKAYLKIKSDGGLIKRALAELSHAIEAEGRLVDGTESSDSDLGRSEGNSDSSEGRDALATAETGEVEGENREASGSDAGDPWAPREAQ